MRLTASALKKIELIFEEINYKVRYEKGNFTPDYCILEQKKIVIVNRYFDTEAKAESLINILLKLDFSEEKLSEKSSDFYQKLKALNQSNEQ